MIDQSLVNHVESYILNGENLPVHVSENILDAYISLIEQNAELHKELVKSKKVISNACCLCGLCHLER
jgi:hypothetical protein